MNTLKTTLVSALTLGAMTVTFAGDALADHKQGRGGKGRGVDVVDVYIDAGHNRQLERLIGENLARYNPYVNIVYSPRYADVTVSVNGYLSKPYRNGSRYGRYRSGFVAIDYDYKIKVRSGGRVLYKDRIYGQVSERTGRRQSGLHYNSTSKGELAIEAFGLFVDIVGGNRGQRGGYGYGGNVQHQLTHEAYAKVAEYVAHIKIPRKGRRYR
ncbi:MAG: hypothetical protein ACTSU8_06355 [Alphaproteobacteria bacterium]